MRYVSLIEHIQQDLRFGFRMLVRSPGFSLLAILCLTVGIGANAAVFSWIEGILFRPYPKVAHQEQLMVLAGTISRRTGLQRSFMARLPRSSQELQADRRVHRGKDRRHHAQHRRPR